MPKNQRILNLHHAQVALGDIVKTLGVPESTIYWVISNRQVERKKRGSPSIKKLTEKFLAKIATTVEDNPTVSIWNQTKKLKVAKSTIRNGLKLLRKKSLVRPPVPLLIERLKISVLSNPSVFFKQDKKSPMSTVKIFSDKKLITVDQVNNR
jgi:hypothetical protein